MQGRLRFVPDYQYRNCLGEIRPLEGLPAESVIVSNESLGVVNKLCYLGDMNSADGIVGESVGTRIRCGWNKFRDILSSLSRYFQCAQKVKSSRHVPGCCCLW